MSDNHDANYASISRELGEIKQMIASANQRCDDRMGGVCRKVSEVRDCVFGDGSDSNPGLKLEVDRLRQKGKRGVAADMGSGAGVLGIWVWKVWEALTGGG